MSKAKTAKPVHTVEPSKLLPPQRLSTMACRNLLKELESIVRTQYRKISDAEPRIHGEESQRLAKLRRDAVVVFLRTHKLPRGWHFRDADTLPERCDLDDVFVAPQAVKDHVADGVALDRRICAEAAHTLYLDAAQAKNKLLIYADPSVVADLDKLRTHDYLAATRRKLGVKELPKAED